MPFARTVLGDIRTAELGIVYAHEHLIIHGGRPVQLFPDFELADIDKAVAELEPARRSACRRSSMPCPPTAAATCSMLAEVGRAQRRQHHRPLRPAPRALLPGPPLVGTASSAEEWPSLFVADITEGIDELDYNGPIVEADRAQGRRHEGRRLRGRPDRPRRRRSSRPRPWPSIRTGCPILTHCEGGTRRPRAGRVAGQARRRPGPHRAQPRGQDRRPRLPCATSPRPARASSTTRAFRWGRSPTARCKSSNGPLEDGLLGHVTLGLDAARQGYWDEFGGSPGWAYLLADCRRQMRERGIGDDVQACSSSTNPALPSHSGPHTRKTSGGAR